MGAFHYFVRWWGLCIQWVVRVEVFLEVVWGGVLSDTTPFSILTSPRRRTWHLGGNNHRREVEIQDLPPGRLSSHYPVKGAKGRLEAQQTTKKLYA